MIGFLLAIGFIVLIALGMPIAFAIGCVALMGMLTLPNVPAFTVTMKMFNGLNSFVMLAVPLFILAANIMNRGKISKMLIDFSIALVGHIKGGLAHANILVSMIFGGVSGSSTADTAGIGKILIPQMIDSGYSKESSIAVTAVSSTIGSIIPPSIPMIIYAGLTNASVAALFMSGMLPGILIGLGMMAVVYVLSIKYDYPCYSKATVKEICKLFKDAAPALLTPVIIIGGIVTGWYTPTEAAAFAAIYAFAISFFYYKTIKLSDIKDLLHETLKLSSLSLFSLAAASALGELMGYYQIARFAENFFSTYIAHRWVFMLFVIALFLFLGTFMDAVPAMILFVPVILPTALSYGIDSVTLGLVVVITVSIGLVTPPYGLCLLLASSIGNLSIEKSFKAVFPYMAIIIAVLLMVALIPGVAMFLPNLFS